MTKTESDFLIRHTLKTLLKRQGAKYQDLAKHLGISVGAVKQIFSKGQLTVQRLESIAQYLGLSFFELMNIVSAHQFQPYKLSLEQEKLIAPHPMAFRLMLLLGAGFSFDKFNTSLSESKRPAAKKALYVLDKAGLIELQPGDQIRVIQRGPYHLNLNGPLEKKYKSEHLKYLVSQISSHPAEHTMQKSFELYATQELYDWMKEETSKLIKEFSSRSRIEVQIKNEDEIFPVAGLMFMKPFAGLGSMLEKLSSH